MSGRPIAALVLALLLGGGGSAGAAPPAGEAPDDRVLPAGEHRTDKARRLAQSYAHDVRQLNREIYHCMPWLAVEKYGIGFYKPRHVVEDARYLSLRVYIEQDPSPAFAALSVPERVEAMFSRYVRPLLRRMVRTAGMLNDPDLAGFNPNLEWVKQIQRTAGERPVHEGIQVFIDRLLARDFLAGALPISELAGRSHVRRWDGEVLLGPMALASAWEDDFVSTFAVKDYQPTAGVACR